jgi:hypothetical protein
MVATKTGLNKYMNLFFSTFLTGAQHFHPLNSEYCFVILRGRSYNSRRILILFTITTQTLKNKGKKVNDFPVPSRDVTDQTLPGQEKLNYSRPGRV